MKEILEDIEENVSQFNWEKDSLLHNADDQTDCMEIFEATCLEIGKYYRSYGVKTFKKKIQHKFDDFKLEIRFSSSGYNQKGDFVWLEITSGVYPNKLVKSYKENKERLQPIIFANTNLLDYKLEDYKTEGFFTKRINIIGEENIVESKFKESTTEYSRGINLYKLSLDQFKLVLKYINRIFRKSIEITTDKKHLMKYLQSPTQRQLNRIVEKRTIDFINIYYDKDLEIQSRIKELTIQKNNPL